MRPTVGRVVHVVLLNGQHRRADVVNAFGNDQPNLAVTLDTTNDLGYAPGPDGHWAGVFPDSSGPFLQPAHLVQLDSVPYDETGTVPGTWHWPERE